MLATLSSVIGAVAALLAAMGLFGLSAHRVVTRTREIGVRMALGATQGEVRQREILGVLQLTAIGVAVGIPLTLAAGVTIRVQMFGVTTSDAIALSVSTALLVAVAAVASFVPALRASRVDPLIALRSD